MCFYLPPEPLAEASGYHAPGVGLDGQHGAETPPERLADDEPPAAGLDEGHAAPSGAVARVILSGPVDGLQTQEAAAHLDAVRKEVM